MSYVSESFWHDAVNKAATDLFTFGYKNIIKPNFVFNVPPDEAHDRMITFCKVAKRVPPLMWACREMLNYTDPVLETEVMGVEFANPFGLSAGLDKNCEMPVLLDNAGFGFETVGSTTSRPCAGNPKPWFHRLPEYDSMMVHVGLANIGSDKVIDRAEQAWTNARDMQVSVSIARTNDDKVGDLDEGIEDYCISMRRAAGRTAMVEVNVSCPNTTAGEPFTQTPENLDRLFAALDGIDRPQPTLVKLPLNKPWGELHELLDVLAEHNVQGVSLANLQKDIEAVKEQGYTYKMCELPEASQVQYFTKDGKDMASLEVCITINTGDNLGYFYRQYAMVKENDQWKIYGWTESQLPSGSATTQAAE